MNRFELLRFEKGLTRVEVAAGTGVKQRTLRAIETGQVSRPSAPVAKALADFYGMSVAELLGVDERSVA